MPLLPADLRQSPHALGGSLSLSLSRSLNSSVHQSAAPSPPAVPAGAPIGLCGCQSEPSQSCGRSQQPGERREGRAGVRGGARRLSVSPFLVKSGCGGSERAPDTLTGPGSPRTHRGAPASPPPPSTLTSAWFREKAAGFRVSVQPTLDCFPHFILLLKQHLFGISSPLPPSSGPALRRSGLSVLCSGRTCCAQPEERSLPPRRPAPRLRLGL